MKSFFSKNKLIIYLLISVFIIGAIGTLLLKQQDNNDKTTTIIDSSNSNKDTNKDTNEEISTIKDTWDSTSTYNGGDEVIFGGKVFKARWWTQGEQPNSSNEWGAWELIGDASSTNNSDENDSTLQEYIPTGDPLDPSKFKVVGYFPEWKPSKEKEIQYDKLTHINYSFAIPTPDGTIKPLTEPDLAKRIIKKAHSNKVKVLIAVGGWEYNGTPLEATFVAATDSDSKIQKLADSILALVDEYGFDGVDMDWEHPRTDGNSKVQYATLLKYLKQGLDKRDKLLTAAVLAGVNAEGGVLWDAAGHTDEALSYLDWINVMAYDGGDGDRHSSFDFAVYSANYWLKNRKLPPEKVVLGVPFYGRPSWASYEEILQADKDAYKKDIAMISGKEAHYNGISTIKKKTNWALDNCSGIMIWEITQDTIEKDKSLLNAIYEEIK